MPHLTLEALARLVDEPPLREERTHLDACADCRTELEALVEQGRALASLPALVPGPDQWPALRARLEEEGLLRGRRVERHGLRRAAAAVLLFLAGGATGYVAGTPAASPMLADGDPSARVVAAGPSTATGPGSAGDAGQEVEAAGELFMAALDRYMAASGGQAPDPAARLAALDNIVLTTAEALHESPADPIISSYHLSALAQRNAVLRQLAVGNQPVF